MKFCSVFRPTMLQLSFFRARHIWLLVKDANEFLLKSRDSIFLFFFIYLKIYTPSRSLISQPFSINFLIRLLWRPNDSFYMTLSGNLFKDTFRILMELLFNNPNEIFSIQSSQREQSTICNSTKDFVPEMKFYSHFYLKCGFFYSPF